MAIQLGSAYGKVSIDSSGVKSGVDSANKSLGSMENAAKKLGATLQNVGRAMTVAFTIPLALAGRSALKTFQEYEKSMNILGSVSNATAEEMKKLADLAKELGADLTLPGTSAADAAQAMAELAKAGMSVNDIMAASKGVLQMSAAGQLSNAEAAEVTANALNAFKLSGEEAVRVADLLAAGANSSSAEVREMADSLQMSASVFAMAGMNIEDLVTAIALMANSGIQGSDAGTSLKQMLLSLQAPSGKAADLMSDLGIAVYDASGNMLPMRDIIANFSKQLSKLTQEQRNAALAIIFGSDAVRAANIVLLGGVDAYDKMSLAVNKTGAAADLAAAMMKGLTGAMENVKSAFETASIAAIEPFKDDIATLLGFVAKALNAFAALPEPVRKFIVIALFLLAVMGPFLVVLGAVLPMVVGRATKSLNPFSGGIFGLIGAFVKWIGVAALIVKILTALGISTGPVGAGILAVQAAIAGVGGTIAGILLPIILIIGALALLYWAFKTNFMGITDTAKQLWFIIKFYFSEGWKWLVNAVKGGGTMVMEWFKRMIDRIVAAFKNINWAQIGRNMILGIVNGLLGGIPSLVAAAGRVAQAALNAIKGKLGIKSPSAEFMKLGNFSGQGFQAGLTKAMDPNLIARTMAKPVQNMTSQQNTRYQINMASGLTLRDLDDMMNRKIDKFTMQLNSALGGQ